VTASPEAGDARTASEALASFYAQHDLPADGGHTAPRWRMTLGPLALTVPNFRWRSRALPVHDLHHLLTGYPCSPAGEFEMAAWEFAAGRYPHPGATAFCLPLVGVGALLQPRRTFAAFLRGRRSRTLYGQGLTPAVLQASLAQLKARSLPAACAAPTSADRLAYGALVAGSLAWSLAPALLLAGWLLAR
jgi:hypothetical protein